MQNIVVSCHKNQTCNIVCSDKNCKQAPFMCLDDQCQCQKLHNDCLFNIKWKKLKQKLENKLKRPSNTFLEYFNQINKIYRDILKMIQKSLWEVRYTSNIFGLSQLEKDVVIKLKKKRFAELNGSLINQLETNLASVKSLELPNIEKQKQQIRKLSQTLVIMLEGLAKFKSNTVQQLEIHQKEGQRLRSSITNDIETIVSFFTKKIKNINLLYRASQNNFQVKEFWNRCNRKINTITIVKTQFDKIYGGYTPLPWSQNLKGWQTDESKQSFIFSISQKVKLKLNQGSQNHAIYNARTFGPWFGNTDISIYEKANEKKSNYVRPGTAYNNGEYNCTSNQSRKKFSGEPNGDNFLISEWEVHEVIFE